MATRLRTPTTDREARMALASITHSDERAGIATQVARDGALATWQLVLDGPEGDTTTRRAHRVDLDALEAETERTGARFVVPGDDEWPCCLDDLDHPSTISAGGVPLGLWITGERLSLQKAVAVTGARACSEYGNRAAEELGHELTLAGHTVVANLAYGIDISALRGAHAAAAGGSSPHPVVVLANGHARPLVLQGHEHVVEALGRWGTVVSEHQPSAPLTRAGSIGRARLLAALSTAVVLVEATERSTALLTVDAAEWLGRLTLAVPGPLHSVLSRSPHELIQKGHARLVASAHDVLDEIDAATITDPEEQQ